MANVNAASVSLKAAHVGAQEPTAVTCSAGDTLVMPAHPCILRVVNGAAACTLTILSPLGSQLNKVVSVAASKAEEVRIVDTSYFRQADGTMHVTASAALTAVQVTTDR